MNSTAFLFPGQGSQYVGMAKLLCQQYPEALEIFNTANSILGYQLDEICFNGPEDHLTRTFYAQPAIFVTSIAAHRILRKTIPELKPSLVAGLSLGEFSALVAANSISYEEGLKLVQKRAEAMELAAQNNPGTMASIIGLSQEQCEKIAEEARCEVANLNSPQQIVLSGSEESIEKACQLAENQGARRAMRLKVGGAFHSTLMNEAKDALQSALSKTSIKSPQCAFIPNAVGKTVSDPEEIRKLLAQQLTSPVQWILSMNTATLQGIDQACEVGPGKVLKGLAKKCGCEFSVTSCETPDDFKAIEEIVQGDQNAAKG